MIYLKHLRGKHDQKDHGRRAVGGGVSSQATSRVPSTPEMSDVADQGRRKGRDTARTLISQQGSTKESLDALRAMIGNQRNIVQTAVRQGGRRPDRNAGERIVREASIYDGLREQYNESLSTFRRDQALARAASRRASRTKIDSPNDPAQRPSEPFTSLDGAGLKGWARQRPAKAPDYSAYDAATRDLPPQFRDPRIEQSETIPPLSFRNVTQTPEGEPVRMIVASDTTDTRSLRDLQLDDVFDIFERDGNLIVSSAEFRDTVFEGGERFFSEQRSSSPLSNDPSVEFVVNYYGQYGFSDLNNAIRGKGEAMIGRISIHTQKYTEATKIGERNWQRKTIEGLVRKADEQTEQIQVMDQSMRPVPEHVFVRRGVGVNTFRRMQANLQVGDRFTDDCFVSASIDPTFNWRTGGTQSPMVNVIVSAGTPALWTDGNALKAIENEVILGRGITYEVISTDSERGWILRTIPPEGTYRPPNPDFVPDEAREIIRRGVEQS